MSYRIPKKRVVSEVIREAITEAGEIKSLNELTDRANRRLKKIDAEYKLSSARCREISASSSNMSIILGKKEYRGRDCPVCDGEIDSLMDRTIDGTIYPSGFRCGRCGYYSKRYLRIPVRYFFKK